MLRKFLEYEWVYWLVACVCTVMLNPARFPFFAALPLFWLARHFADRPIFPSRKIILPIIGLLAMVGVSAWVTPDLEFSLRKIAGLVNGMGLFLSLGFAIQHYPKLADWLLLIFGLIIAGSAALAADIGARIPLLFPLFRFFYIFVPFFPNVSRVLNSNMMGGALLLTLLPSIGFALWLWHKQRIAPAGLVLISIVAQLFMLLIMQSRAAFLGAAIGTGFMVWLLRPTLRRRVLTFGFTLIAIGLVASLPIWPDAIEQRLEALYFDTLVKGDEGKNGLESIEARLIIWERAVEEIGKQPLAGSGLNIFRTVANEPESILPRAQAIPHAHNWALQILLELGTLGLILYLWLLFAAASTLRQNWLTQSESHVRVAGYAAGILSFMIFGLLDTISPGARPDYIFWILLAGSTFIATSAETPSHHA